MLFQTPNYFKIGDSVKITQYVIIKFLKNIIFVDLYVSSIQSNLVNDSKVPEWTVRPNFYIIISIYFELL